MILTVQLARLGAILTLGDSCATAGVGGLDPCGVHPLPPYGPLWLSYFTLLWPPVVAPFHHLLLLLHGWQPTPLGPLQCPLPLLS